MGYIVVFWATTISVPFLTLYLFPEKQRSGASTSVSRAVKEAKDPKSPDAEVTVYCGCWVDEMGKEKAKC